jgi:ABC-2 type transport system ATP-binding protein
VHRGVRPGAGARLNDYFPLFDDDVRVCDVHAAAVDLVLNGLLATGRKLRGLVKRFGELTAVSGLELDVRAGEVFGLLGPNGAGKTTTIRVVCGELAADAGSVLLHGRALGTSARDRARVGLCPQEIVVWHQLTCLEQLEFVGRLHRVPARQARLRGRRLLDELGLDEAGLADQADTLAGRLSGGMQRRLNIALALVHAPELVILDESGAGLDPASRVLVREFVRGLARETSVLVTTHEMDEAERICDRVAIVDHGRLLACASPDELRLPGPATAEPGAKLGAEVAEAAGVPECAVSVDRFTLTLRCERAATVLPAVLTRLAGHGVTPAEVRLRQARLEDVFLDLTGRSVRP